MVRFILLSTFFFFFFFLMMMDLMINLVSLLMSIADSFGFA